MAHPLERPDDDTKEEGHFSMPASVMRRRDFNRAVNEHREIMAKVKASRRLGSEMRARLTELAGKIREFQGAYEPPARTREEKKGG